MDAESLTFLLRGGHYNMEQRRERGIWPHASLQFEDVVQHLIAVLEHEEWFPFQPEPNAPGEAVYEGVLIERLDNGRFVCHCQHAQPLVPSRIAEKIDRVFKTAEQAARFYMHWYLHLPGDLDGWKVVE